MRKIHLVRVRALAIVLVCNECINLPAKNKRSRTQSHYECKKRLEKSW
jgi:hypothetical protein